jgi:glutamate carboxypeptidase
MAPQRVVVHGGIRAISIEQLERVRDAMRTVVAEHLPHTDAAITYSDRYPAMSRRKATREGA